MGRVLTGRGCEILEVNKACWEPRVMADMTSLTLDQSNTPPPPLTYLPLSPVLPHSPTAPSALSLAILVISGVSLGAALAINTVVASQ